MIQKTALLRPDVDIPIEYQGFSQLEAAFDKGIEACLPYIERLEKQLHQFDHRHKNDEAANKMLQEAYEIIRRKVQGCEKCKLVVHA